MIGNSGIRASRRPHGGKNSPVYAQVASGFRATCNYTLKNATRKGHAEEQKTIEHTKLSIHNCLLPCTAINPRFYGQGARSPAERRDSQRF